MIRNITLSFLAFLWFGTARAQVYVAVGFSQPPLLLANAGIDGIICEGDTLGIGGNPAGSGGTPSFNYFWSTSTSITASNIANPGAFPSATASYILTVTDARGCTASDTVLVTVDTCVGIYDQAFPIGVSVFPNPSEGKFTLRFEGAVKGNPITININNSIGQLILSRELEMHSGTGEEVFNLPPVRGTYYVEILNGTTREVRKITIQ